MSASRPPEPEVDRHQALAEENLRLIRQLAAVEAERDRLRRDFVELEQRHNDLCNLYVAADQLHGTHDEQAVVAAIEEIVINLIGCEQFGVYELDVPSGEMRLVRAFGLPHHIHDRLDASQGVLGRAVETGEVILPSPSPVGTEATPPPAHERGLTACVPLKVSSRVAGVILLFELLPQKSGRLEPIDNELLALLAAQAGSAVHASRLLARSYGTGG